MTLILLTLIVAGAWYLFAAVDGRAPLSTRAVLAGIGASGQLVLTLTFFGAISRLKPGPIAFTNALLSTLLVVATVRAAGGPRSLLAILGSDLRAFGAGARAALAWETILLAGLLTFAGLWIATAIAFYPPRGIDDVTYHLPPIYQAVQDHRLVLLPVALRGHFAYPLNGELLFLWVALFTHAIRWVDAPQAILWLLGMAAVFALGRRFSLTPRGSFLAAALFGMMPVSLLQAPSNYVDLISGAWLISAAVALWQYEETGSRLALLLAGLAVGLVAGTKVSTLPLALLLVVFTGLIVRHRVPPGRTRAAAVALFALPLVASCGYWYLRDWIILGNPIFPYPLRIFRATIFRGTLEIGKSSWSAIFSDPREAVRIALWDPGLGSFHGGFGFLFWGFAAPAVALQAVRTLREGGARRTCRFLVLLLLPCGLGTLLLVGHADLFVFARLVLCVGAPAFIAFALLIDAARGRLPGVATSLRGLAVGSSAAAVVLMASARWPLMNLAPVAADTPAQRAVSELRYLASTAWDHRAMFGAWAPLDAITRGGAGLTVYQAVDWPVFWTAPTYGTELQNRIWNFVQDPRHPPEAFFFHSWTGNPTYVGREIRRETVAGDRGVRLVASERDDATTLYVSEAALAEKDRSGRLANYYRLTAPAAVTATADSLSRMEPGSVLLAPFPFAGGYIVHEAEGRLGPILHPIAARDQNLLAVEWPDRVIYTIGQPIPGRSASVAATLSWPGLLMSLYRNEVPSATRASPR